MLLGEARALGALLKGAKASRADETLLAAQRGGRTTLRFADGRIHQNFHEEDVTVWVKAACGGQMGVATTCSLSREAIEKAVGSAITIAQVAAKRMPHGFSTAPAKRPAAKPKTHFPATVHQPLGEIVRRIRGLNAVARKSGMALAGSLTLGEDELAVAGSRGLRQYQPFSVAGIRLVATQGKASGFASCVVRDLERLDAESALAQAMKICRRNRDPQPIPLGKYDVLLEPEAVAELTEWLSGIGFGAKQVLEGTSFLAGRIGEKIVSRKITLWDDGPNPEGMAVPFDFEGIPKEKIFLIDRGVASGIVYDSHYAKLHRRHSTGHALAYDETEGPLAANLFMAAGETPHEEMISRMDRGIWITRFHYVNGLLNTQEALMTGLTRDGTFLVKNGKVVQAVKNLRFTQSILEAFSQVAAVSRERRLIADPAQGFSAAVCPALLIRGFTFTGQTT